MGIVTGILVYVVLWWLIFLVTMPWGHQPLKEPVPGSVKSAPENPRLILKALITTTITTIIFYLLYLFVPADLMQWGIYREV